MRSVNGTDTKQQYLVPAVVSASRILALLAGNEGSGMTQTEVGLALDLSKSTTFNLLGTLDHLGFVDRDPATMRYRLGGTLVGLGHAAVRGIDVLAAAGDRLPELAARAELSFAVAQVAATGLRAQVVDRAYQTDGVHVGIPLGSQLGVFDGAVGKILLAGLTPAAAVSAVGKAPIPAHTGNTLVEPAELLAAVDSARTQGWAASIQELNENNAVAAGIQGPSGDIEAVIFALGFPRQLTPEAIPEVGAMLRAVADEIAASCGVFAAINP